MPGDQMLESGWEELGITPERASEIASEMNDEAPLNAEAFYSVRTRYLYIHIHSASRVLAKVKSDIS